MRSLSHWHPRQALLLGWWPPHSESPPRKWSLLKGKIASLLRGTCHFWVKTASWPHVIAEDLVMLCQDRLNLSCPDVWKNREKQGGVFLSFCSVFPAVCEWGGRRRMAPGQRDTNPGAEGRGRFGVSHLQRWQWEAALSTRVCPCPSLGGPEVKAGGVCDGEPGNSWEQGVIWGQGRAGETPRLITTSHWLNIRCALEVINGTFLLLLENAVLLKLERFLSRCCFLSSYEWKKTTKPKQKNPFKTKQNKQSPSPKGSLSCKHLWRDPAGFSSCGPSEPIPAAHRVPQSMSLCL